MVRLWPEHEIYDYHPKDGERWVPKYEYSHSSACSNIVSCQMSNNGCPRSASDKEWPVAGAPLTALQGRWYCRDCYPKMVAILEADAKLAKLKEDTVTPDFIRSENARSSSGTQ